ncbi:hypothetical protein L6164_006232 [Bauhinia variegata]|uniref:Uncharacterized protein n=1 Tax=Bauhinia variegata TaxID=167791 RepID=A0ACB9PTT6_BAUVA|nr:hypothetical protein L6164_006232 [Bauhinia variegata]
MVVLRVAFMLFLVGIIAHVDARFYIPENVAAAPDVVTTGLPFINADTILNSKDSSNSSGACCDQCQCTDSDPIQCQCVDVTPYCRTGWKQCTCTRSLSPRCHCNDITSACYPQCTGTGTKAP